MRPPPKKVAHISLDARRRKFSVRENAFATLWEHENVPRRGFSFGNGILQDLMFTRQGDGIFSRMICRHWIRNRDAAIVATVMQWLGTNVGWCFLERALHRCGWKLERVEAEDRSWVKVAERLPAESGRYLVRTRIGLVEEANFLVGTVPGKLGLWTSYDGRCMSEYTRVLSWWEAERLGDWRNRGPFKAEAA